MILHDNLSLFPGCTQLTARHPREIVTKSQTQKSRRPLRVVGYMTSRLSLSYAMASSIISRISTARFGERGIGQLALAGLFIFKKAGD